MACTSCNGCVEQHQTCMCSLLCMHCQCLQWSSPSPPPLAWATCPILYGSSLLRPMPWPVVHRTCQQTCPQRHTVSQLHSAHVTLGLAPLAQVQSWIAVSLIMYIRRGEAKRQDGAVSASPCAHRQGIWLAFDTGIRNKLNLG